MPIGDKVKLEIVEKYSVLGEKRYVVRITGTRISVNVKAESDEEALSKAKRLLFG